MDSFLYENGICSKILEYDEGQEGYRLNSMELIAISKFKLEKLANELNMLFDINKVQNLEMLEY